jgi:putative redox protein
MYAEMKGWDLGQVECEVDVEQGKGSVFEEITVTLRVHADIDEAQRERLVMIAGKCPVHRALSGESQVLIHDRIEAL